MNPGHTRVWVAAAALLAGTAAADPSSAPSAAPGADLLRRGQYERAAAQLGAQADTARAAGDAQAELAARLALAEAQQGLGLFAAASDTLVRALALAEASGDPARVAAVRGALGNSYVAANDFARAEPALAEATAQARAAKATALAAALGNNLGNHHTLRAARSGGGARMEQQSRAEAAYAAALADARAAGDASLSARILANQARLALARGEAERCRDLLAQASAQLAAAPSGHDAVLTRIHLGRTWLAVVEASPRPAAADLLAAHALLVRAQEDARAQGDLRARAWAEGTLGALYAASGRREDALTLTQRALDAASQAGAPDAQLRFQAQSASLLRAVGREDESLAAYRTAVEQLAELRPALALAYGADASFESGPGRVYRELVDLLLARAARTGKDPRPELLEVQQVMERFKAAELRDYFHDDCVDAWRARITTAADASLGALVVYPIVLDDRLELLVTSQAGMRRYAVPVSREALTEEVRAFRRLLAKRTTREYLPHAQKLYGWLVAPYAAQLEAAPPQALVFVPDGVLRIIPMAALHDGERFLVERVPLATTPGLELTDPRPLDREARFLVGGLAESAQGFEALPHVKEELAAIHERFGGDLLLDSAFVELAVAEHIAAQSYGVVHLASHGVLGADVSESYLLTHDGRIELQELSSYVSTARYREQPIELITLSACETAAGDERAALGLSGLAVKAGARSALGALWSVNDVAASELMVSFYRHLGEPSTSRALALAKAQRELIADARTRHPAFWAPFLLISNWL